MGVENVGSVMRLREGWERWRECGSSWSTCRCALAMAFARVVALALLSLRNGVDGSIGSLSISPEMSAAALLTMDADTAIWSSNRNAKCELLQQPCSWQ